MKINVRAAAHPFVIGTTVTFLVFLVSCSRDLNQTEAVKQIKEHFNAVAPKVFKSVNIKVIEILSPNENNREVRFTEDSQWVRAAEIKEPKNLASKTGIKSQPAMVYSVFFQKSSKGWSLKKYGQGTANLLTRMRIERVSMDYAPVLETMYSLSTATAKIDNLLSRVVENDLRAAITAKNIQIPDGVVWGFRPRTIWLEPDVLWVKHATNTRIRCAIAMGAHKENVHLLSGEFGWLSRKYGFLPTCVGRDHVYNYFDILDGGNSAIEENGGLFPSYSP